MRILVYGAGVLGSICALRLSTAGHDVTLLARGERLVEIRSNGLRLVEYASGESRNANVSLVESFGADDRYDLALIMMQRQQAIESLPTLARNRVVPTFLFIGNCAAGVGMYAKALGENRVLLGFVLSGGYIEEGVVRYGERDGVIPTIVGGSALALGEVAEVLKGAFGSVEIDSDIEGWLTTHAATIVPLACALYSSGGDASRLSRTRDGIVLGIRAVRELFEAERRLGIKMKPKMVRTMIGLPEPILAFLMSRSLRNPEVAFGLRHALVARREMLVLAGELRELVSRARVSAPYFEIITGWIDPSKPPLSEGNRAIPLEWRGVYFAAIGAFILLIVLWRILM